MNFQLLHDLLPATQRRVQENTAAEVNAQNRRQADSHVARYRPEDREAIAHRIGELEREWDIERTLEANAAVVVLITLALGLIHDSKWFALTGVAAAFLLQHALQGWCPPVPIFRRRGVRTEAEIFEEITALRVLRGDLQPTSSPGEAVAQVRALHLAAEGK